MKCSKCGSGKISKRGIRRGKQRQRCNDCGNWDSFKLFDNKGRIKVLLFDIETTPIQCFVWQLNSKSNNYINHGNIIEDWNILSWSAKWLYDSEVMSDIQTPKEAKKRDDKRICGSIWRLLDEADIIIAHNGDRFDIKKLNTRFFMNGLNPPSPYQSIDTLRVAKRSFAFSSNRLDYLGQIMTNKGKLETNFQLWKDCLKGDKSQLDRMLAYNEEDVRLLEEVYVQLRPWVKSHPNMGLNSSGSCCPNCGSDEIKPNGGYYTTMTNMYESYRCDNCGGLSRQLKGELGLNERRELMRSLPR